MPLTTIKLYSYEKTVFIYGYSHYNNGNHSSGDNNRRHQKRQHLRRNRSNRCNRSWHRNFRNQQRRNNGSNNSEEGHQQRRNNGSNNGTSPIQGWEQRRKRRDETKTGISQQLLHSDDYHCRSHLPWINKRSMASNRNLYNSMRNWLL